MKYYFFIVTMVLISCKPLHSNLPKNNTNPKTPKKEPQIVFYFLKAIQDIPSSTITVKFMHKKIVKGTLKGIYNENISQEKFSQDHWIVTFLASEKQNNVQLQINNPLIENIEFINEESNLERKNSILKSKEFVIRTPFKGIVKSILFEKISSKNQKLVKKEFQNIKI